MLASIAILGLLGSTFAALSPAVNKVEDSHAAPVQSETTLAMTTPSASLSLKVEDADGTFVASDPSDFTVTTNNYTGYTLNISAKVDDENSTKLVNGNYALDSIETATADGTGFSVGDWGYKPSKIDSADNTDFLPAPTYEGSIINATNSANATADAYSLAIAAKADYSTTVGTYSNTFVLTAVPNPVNYTITYDKNTTDNVTNMPATQIGTLSDQNIIISSTVPSRAGYNFDGWCDGDVTTASGAQSCSGTEYNPGAVYAASMQTANTLSLKAVWNVAATARAVLGSNGNLNFVYDNNTYTVGNTYTDNLGSTTISAVYDVPTNSSFSSEPAWVGKSNNSYRTDITSVNFAQSFSRFKPTSTAYWFDHDQYISSITNASNLNTSNVTDMTSMFSNAGYNATTWNIGGLSSWNVSSVTDMSTMFGSAGRNATTWSIGDLSSWNVSSVTDMSSMFNNAGYKATTWDIGNLSSWNVSNVTNMSYMFTNAGNNATTWNIGNLSSWIVSNVTNMSYMFNYAGYKATTFSLDLSSWNVSSVTDMSTMFGSAGRNATTWSIGNLSSWDVSSVTKMSSMFNGAGYSAQSWSVGDIGSWGNKTSKVTNMSNMFRNAGYSATTWNIGNLSSWDVSKVTNMSSMFNTAGYKATTFSLDLSSWKVSNVTNMSNMFDNAGRFATTWNIGNLSSWDVSKVTNMLRMFYYAGYNAAYTLDLRSWSVPKVTIHANFNDGVTTKVLAPTFPS